MTPRDMRPASVQKLEEIHKLLYDVEDTVLREQLWELAQELQSAAFHQGWRDGVAS